MRETAHGASRIKTLRLAVGPGASAMIQLAAAVTGKGSHYRRHISVAGFYYPYRPGFPIYAHSGRRPQPPAYAEETSTSP